MDLRGENPWKLKGKIKFISCCDVLLQSFGILYSSYQMFYYYMYIGDQDNVSEIMKGPGHIPFYIFVWFTLTLHYIWLIVISVVLYSAVSLEATETDPHTSIQKCQCWIRTARLNLFIIFVKLCLQPLLLILEHTTYLYGILVGIRTSCASGSGISFILSSGQNQKPFSISMGNSMYAGTRILQVVALLDMILAISISCYVCFLVSQGPELIPGHLSETEKITRLVVYSTLLFVFLSIQLYMAIQLMRATKWVFERPLKSLKAVGIWLEWSFVYLLFIALHGATALLLMKDGRRKHVILFLSTIQTCFRVCGILITAKHQYILPMPIAPNSPTKV